MGRVNMCPLLMETVTYIDRPDDRFPQRTCSAEHGGRNMRKVKFKFFSACVCNCFEILPSGFLRTFQNIT